MSVVTVTDFLIADEVTSWWLLEASDVSDKDATQTQSPSKSIG